MIEITYLLNSGFLVRVGRTLLVFDDFKDPAGAVDAAVEAADFDHLYFFASHGHFDHFDAHICAYEAKTERYIRHGSHRAVVRSGIPVRAGYQN